MSITIDVSPAASEASLPARLGDRLLRPGDAGYHRARSIWNGAIDRRPALIARCTSSADVAAAVRFATAHGLEVSVRGGGHGAYGFAVTDGGLMIDLSLMKEVLVDPAARRAVVGPGASLGELDAATQAHGLAVPAGSVSHTGVAGLTLGGGIGWLTPKAGLTIDNLVSAEVVTAGGALLTASADENPDLFWAIRGGGGNFGVVTAFEFRLHEVGPVVHLGFFFWAAEQGAGALRHARDAVATLPEDMGAMIVGMDAPPAPFVPARHIGAPGYALAVVGFGSAEEHRRAVEPVRRGLPPLFELVTPMRYTEVQSLMDDAAPWGLHRSERALYLDDLSDDAIAAVAEHLSRKPSPLSLVLAIPLRGAFERVGDDETAFAGRRVRGYTFSIGATAPTAELLRPGRAWARSFWEALRPHARGAGAYVNFLTDADQDRVRASYGAAKYERLARIKARYDPDNLFHLNANIKPLTRRTR